MKAHIYLKKPLAAYLDVSDEIVIDNLKSFFPATDQEEKCIYQSSSAWAMHLQTKDKYIVIPWESINYVVISE